MSITTVLFDFGGVIWTPLDQKTVQVNRNRLAQTLGLGDGEAMWRYFYCGKEWELTKTGHWTHSEMWSALLAPLGILTTESQNNFVEALFQGVGLNPQMERLIKFLHEKLTLGILSNASDVLETKINEQLGIGDYFQVVVNSHDIGVAKPQFEAYQIAMNRLGVKPDELLFIDDQKRNTNAAELMGIRSHVFTSVAALKRELHQLNLLTEYETNRQREDS